MWFEQMIKSLREGYMSIQDALGYFSQSGHAYSDVGDARFYFNMLPIKLGSEVMKVEENNLNLYHVMETEEFADTSVVYEGEKYFLKHIR